jgi:hypothetical protein
MEVFNLDYRLKTIWGTFQNPDAKPSSSKIRNSQDRTKAAILLKFLQSFQYAVIIYYPQLKKRKHILIVYE